MAIQSTAQGKMPKLGGLKAQKKEAPKPLGT